MLICISIPDDPLFSYIVPILSSEPKISSTEDDEAKLRVLDRYFLDIFSIFSGLGLLPNFSHSFPRKGFDCKFKWSRNRPPTYCWPRCHGSRQNLPLNWPFTRLAPFGAKTIPMIEFRVPHKIIPLLSSKRIYDTLGPRLRLQRLLAHPRQYSTLPRPEEIAKEIPPKQSQQENPETREKPIFPPRHFF
jgi:hypothetical protein